LNKKHTAGLDFALDVQEYVRPALQQKSAGVEK